MNSYLQSFLPFADTPSQLAQDLERAKVRFQVLTPQKLRSALQTDSRVHCTRLRGRPEVVAALLRYCLSDLVSAAAASAGPGPVDTSQSEYQERRNFAQLRGCPLLVMADGRAACFPQVGVPGEEPVYTAPLSLLATLNPAVRGSLLHCSALSSSAMFQNPIFRDTLQIKALSTSFIRVNYYFLCLDFGVVGLS